MKRVIAFMLCVILCVGLLTACGKDKDSAAATTETTVPETTVPETTVPETTVPETTVPETTVPETTVPETTDSGLAEIDGRITIGQEFTGTAGAGEEIWLAVTTSGAADSAYQISVTNQTQKSVSLYALLSDEAGAVIQTNEAKGGKTVLIDAGKLEASTTYLLRLNPVAAENIDYTILVTEIPSNYTQPGSNQNHAVLVPQETLVHIRVPAQENAWLSFTTGSKQTTYNLTCVHETAGGGKMYCAVLDEFGTEQGSLWAHMEGVPVTVALNQLVPNSTYYVRVYTELYSKQIEQDFSVIIRDANRKAGANKTTDNLAAAVDPEALIKSGAVPGSNANLALALPFGYQYSGICPVRGDRWFSFTTGDNPEAVYKVTGVNETAHGGTMRFYIYDMYGTCIESFNAGRDGVAVTRELTGLTPNTLYYVHVDIEEYSSGKDQGYGIRIVTSEPVKEDTLVFETPFEINETQVQFVVNKAIFIDKQKAMTVLQPVAEAILAHPDKTILIAGSTATDGTQESCIGLSVQRAEAVRDLLVNTYGVPAAQIKVVGMGYADDPFERGQDIDANGNFVESEAVKNRRVVVLDADDPIAKDLIKKAK